MPHEDVIQGLYDSEINVTITMLWDGGFDFALTSYMELQSIAGKDKSVWANVATAADLSRAIHSEALQQFPGSAYTRLHGG